MTALLPSKVRSDAWADDSEEPDAHVGGRKRDVAWSDIQHTYRDMFGSTVARQLVHKLAVSDVLITDAVEAGRDLLILAAQWPRQHHYYSVAGGALDLVLIAETLRQATILCAHRFYAVPLGHAFLMDRLIVKRDVGHGRRGVPQEVMIKVEMDRVERRHGRLLSLRSSVEFKIGSQIVGAGQGYLRVVDPRVYARMRGSAKPPATGATLDSFVRGVALSPVEAAVELPRRWQLHLDRTHAVFFDHPVDHIPGMVFMEASLQAARAATGWADGELTHFDGTYMQFVELDTFVEVSTPVVKFGSSSRSFVDVMFSQGGSTAVAVRVNVERPPRE